MGDERALVPTKTVSIELLPDEIIYLRKQQMEVIQKMMQENVHMGLIPGAKKPSLWQPGAQLLDNLHGYAPTFTILKEVEDWDKGFFHYVVNCRMIRRRDNIVVGEGIGSCNSREKKFRESVYHGDDEGTPVDPRDNVNTYLKQASKRAHVTATLNATGLSDLFTVDIEDMADQFGEGGKPDKPKVELCPIHNVPWKKNEKEGKVWYSHKTKDGWCNKDKVIKKTEDKAEAHQDVASGTSKPPEVSTAGTASSVAPGQEQEKTGEEFGDLKSANEPVKVDEVWLNESMAKLLGKDSTRYNKLIKDLNKTAGCETGTIMERCNKLSPNLRRQFCEAIEKALK